MYFEAEKPGFSFLILSLPVSTVLGKYLGSLGLSFTVCKMGVVLLSVWPEGSRGYGRIWSADGGRGWLWAGCADERQTSAHLL